jgi:hypothetical protein
MKKRIAVSFVAAAIGCAIAAFAQAGIGGASKDVRPRVELPAPAVHPMLPSQVLKPLY